MFQEHQVLISHMSLMLGGKTGTRQGFLGKDQGGQDAQQGGLPRVLGAVKANLSAVGKECDVEDQFDPAVKQGKLGQ